MFIEGERNGLLAAGCIEGFGFDPVDCEDCGWAGGGGRSSRSKGFVDDNFGEGVGLPRFTANPGLRGNAGVIGVRDPRDEEESPALLPFPSPNRTRVSIVFSRLPPSPFSTARFLFGSANPISRNLAILPAKSSGPVPTFADGLLSTGLLLYSGEGDRLRGSTSTGGGGSRRDFEESGKMEEADLKPNLLPVLGGSGGGWSSELELLPVSCRAAARS